MKWTLSACCLGLALSMLLGCDPPVEPPQQDGGPRDLLPEDGGENPPLPCVPHAETCDGTDEDCDTRVDEGDPEALGCSAGQLCAAGQCACAADTCADGCTDLASDPQHCGACDNACGAGEACTAGGCCAADAVCEGTCIDLENDNLNCGECENECGDGATCSEGSCCGSSSRPVDILFMVDNSNSMTEEQANLTTAFPEMVRALTSGDIDGDGDAESVPAQDVHFGVITSDMGTGGVIVPTCYDPHFGDDGVLHSTGQRTTGCAERYPSFLAYAPSSSTNLSDLAREFGCVATVGTGGCGFEQPLEAVLKAATPSTSATRFFDASTGHADGANAGFLRPDSILVTILLTDEDDCSAIDPDLFNPASSAYGATDLNLRCSRHPGALHGVGRYVDGLLALRSDPSDLLFFPIAGVPAELVGAFPRTYDEILADGRMQETIDPEYPSRLLPSCNEVGTGLAAPPRRIVETARALAARGVTTGIASICQDQYVGFLSAIAHEVAAQQREVTVCRAP